MGQRPYPGPSRRCTGAGSERRGRPQVQTGKPSPINPPSGCVFHPRCPIAVASCSRIRPDLRKVRAGHWVACGEVC
jgi:oligopeptide transport system ATP-binding protein